MRCTAPNNGSDSPLRRMLPLPVYRSIFASSPVGELLLSRDFTILDVNDTFLRVACRRREDLVGQHLFDVFPQNPDDPGDSGATVLRTSLMRVLETGQPDALAIQRYPIAVTLPDGTRRYEERFWSALNTPIFDAQGELLCIAHSTIDVTGLHGASPGGGSLHAQHGLALAEAHMFSRAQMVQEVNNALQAERARLHHLFEQAPGFVCFTQGRAHVIEQANQAFDKLLGQRVRAGRPLREAVPELEGQGLLEQMDEVLRTGRPYIGHDRRLLLRHGAQDPPAEHYIDLVLQPILDENDRVTGICAQGVDITDKTCVEAALRRHARRQSFQLELTDRIRSLDEPEDIIAAASEMLGRELDVARVLYAEIDDRSQRFFVRRDWTHPAHRLQSVVGEHGRLDRFGPDIPTLLRGGEPMRVADVQHDALTAEHAQDFTRLGVRAILAVALVKAGQLTAILSLHHTRPRPWSDDDVQKCQDTAERVWAAVEHARAQAELRDANRRKDEFLAMLAHELRNPLAPISVAAQLMESGRLDAARLKQTSQIISRQVRHMTGLVDDLLDVSRVTRGLVTLHKAPQDLKSIVASAVEQVRPLMEAQRHHLTMDLPPEPAHVLGDAKRLIQILTNLLDNAAKYTPTGGEVALRMQLQDDRVVLQVQDNGIGIEPHLQPRVFDLFIQAERTSDRSQGGLGLGLALVKSLAELHGGQVACHSDGPDQGSCFTVRLPRLVRTAEPLERRRYRRDPQSAVAPLRVLVVDDNVDAAQMLEVLLQTAGHEVTLAHSGLAACEAARRAPPDACLLDIGLPDIDGNELARRLRAHPQTAGAVLIAITGYGQEHDRRTALTAGFDHHLVKPVDPGRLMSLLHEVAAAHLSTH